MARPKTHDDALRTRLLDRAGELISGEGPDALSLRRLAADAGTSTTAVYSLFGGKAALIREVYVEAFRRFNARLAQVRPGPDAEADLVRLGLLYRESALADRHLYAIMFTAVIPGFEPDAQAREQAEGTFAPLLAAVRRAVDEGVLVDEPAEGIAIACWALVHGMVSLELRADLPGEVDAAATYERAIRAGLRGWRRDGVPVA
ncbi:TetR/AcrR family transcriptional regulator [Kutzneria viridogrisea]|uniref:AcrR family transcriptional regulator n=1 Tax=Kutzneria viridogrisea TaxID=47990 RepID=A0ABR6BB97_9PSEU|nr:AcrR family transcriptional regulator [Kutzneria viridogrisea]